MIKVLVFGTFDGLHEGHRDFLQQAKKLGDYLVAVIARDSTVNLVKGHLPRQKENERLAAVKDSGLTDEAMLGNEGDPYAIIKKINPNIIGLGYDQTSFTENLADVLKKENLNIEIVRLKSYKPETYKSSLINKK